MKPAVYFLVGIPGSGKSKFAKNMLTHAANTKTPMIRVNKDDIRAMLTMGTIRPKESLVVDIEEDAVSNALSNGVSVIIDNTHLNPAHRLKYEKMAKEYDSVFIVKVIEDSYDLNLCLERNRLRTGLTRVPEDVIINMHQKFLKQYPKVES